MTSTKSEDVAKSEAYTLVLFCFRKAPWAALAYLEEVRKRSICEVLWSPRCLGATSASSCGLDVLLGGISP